MKESSISRNNMLINAFYIDRELEQTERHPWIKTCVNAVRCLYHVLKYILKTPKHGLRKTLILIKAELYPKSIRDYEMLTGFDHAVELDYCYASPKKSKVAVYTSIFGDYDYVKEPLFVSEGVDYYIITDQEIEPKSIWRRMYITDEQFQLMDDYHKSKYCKIHPHLLFPDYDYSIWIDGNVLVVADLLPLIDRMKSDCSMATFQNPLHDCIYTERDFLIYHNAVKLHEIDRQLEHYRNEGFPAHFGMREFSIIIRRHKDKKLIELMERWWEEVNTFTMRDQISFPYLLWKNGLTIEYIQLLGGNWRYNPRFICTPHNWRIVLR